ncbi:HD-GYP domain-containing protein [Thermotalea metallivorans]|uniref:Cyclic di-GMP phosphodiesterase response regulator RpfG n=1 Tax=Thermotalea metallivorans TaxID=520762 RepID=A0A140L0Z8_9FIRM|nr:HD-GYP domain-containing protein [Thermotalea metallivorans]KXG74223.1 Cyclic di-GMP phosphodiesterase response regulator RpfG [Thermotalea metallivorans]
MRLVRTQDLQEGMILAEDIAGKYDIVFLTGGTVLSDRHIESLKKLDISYIYVMEKTEEAVQEKERHSSVIIVDRQFNKEYVQTIDQFKNMYQQIGLGNKIEHEVVGKFVMPLLKEVVKSNNILGRLRQVESTDAYTFRHSMNVGILSAMIGKWLHYGEKDLENLTIAAMFHDIGKSKIPEEIINKPTVLTEEEFEIVKKHTTYGYEILKTTVGISFDICCGVLQHHERMDGSGYPLGIKGDKIHEFAKIIAVADVFDAMTSQRMYRSKESPFKVAEYIAENSFGILDPFIVGTFLENISRYYVGNIVKLNSGEVGEIVLLNKQMPTRPLVKVNDKFIDLLTNSQYEIVEVIA